MWKLTDWGQTRMPLTGIPWRDLSDEEFVEAEARYPELRERGYFEQVVTEPPAPALSRRSNSRPPSSPPPDEVVAIPRNLEVYPDMTEEDAGD